MAKQPQRPTPTRQQPAPAAAKKAAPAPVRRTEKKENIFSAGKHEFIFGRQNFIYMGIGLGLVILGLITMSGGAMPDPNKWEPGRIYSFRRITLAPMMMVAGFIVVIVGIFKQEKQPMAPVANNTTAE
jgi:thiosulfate reductase cytochrome b subunit